ncbi:MAG: DUF2461 domain-containing protein [Chloroflexi bacterium]|nr:MAG: DUF2461 domain-containing protein [Chloroflexota bacterium]
MPDSATLRMVRDAIVDDPGAWSRIVNDRAFAPMYAGMGETLKRAPQGYDPAHPRIEDLKRKGHTWHVRFTEAEVCSPDLMDGFLSACRTAAPFTRFLAEALKAAW